MVLFIAIDQLSLEMQAAPIGTGGKAGLRLKNPIPGIEEATKAWDDEHLTGRLTTDHVRRQLTEAIDNLLGQKHRRVCVIIDDLDRCDPAVAFRLLEGIKIHLSLPQCVFVLGVNLRQIEQAIAPLLPGAKDAEMPAEKRAEAAEDLEKLCPLMWKLPFLASSTRASLLRRWLADPSHADARTTTPLPTKFRDTLEQTANEFDCLPANPRKIKGIANTIRQLAAHGWSDQAQLNTELPVPEVEADGLLIAATIYHLHPELLRYLQTSRAAWDELLNWLLGKSQLPENASDLLKLLVTLRFPTEVAKGDPEKAATPGGDARVSVFADPVHLNVFRIQELLRASTDPMRRNSVTYDILARYLDLPR